MRLARRRVAIHRRIDLAADHDIFREGAAALHRRELGHVERLDVLGGAAAGLDFGRLAQLGLHLRRIGLGNAAGCDRDELVAVFPLARLLRRGLGFRRGALLGDFLDAGILEPDLAGLARALLGGRALVAGGKREHQRSGGENRQAHHVPLGVAYGAATADVARDYKPRSDLGFRGQEYFEPNGFIMFLICSYLAPSPFHRERMRWLWVDRICGRPRALSSSTCERATARRPGSSSNSTPGTTPGTGVSPLSGRGAIIRTAAIRTAMQSAASRSATVRQAHGT